MFVAGAPHPEHTLVESLHMSAFKLLLINKFYHDQGLAGGVGRYLVQEEEVLLASGWQVIPFGIADADMRPSPWSDHFVRARDYTRPRWSRNWPADALNLIWNREAAAKLDRLIRAERPQVAHVHNIYHHLSPSILPVLRKHRIPVAMTLHDLRLLCPAIHMLRQGEVCERCKGGRFHEAVLGKCVKDSRAASLLAALETWHQHLRHLYLRNVDLFLCPSRFIRDKFISWGYPADRLLHLPNFVDLEEWHPQNLKRQDRTDAYMYFGRISREKGLRTLLDAQALWADEFNAGHTDIQPLRLLIAGDGPCLENLKARVAQLRLSTVDILGPLDRAGLCQAMSRVRFTVLPSEWYENSPMALLESLGMGLPVVGTEIGGIPEIIMDKTNGILVPPRDPKALLGGLMQAAGMSESWGLQARSWVETNASRQSHMKKLREILSDLI